MRKTLATQIRKITLIQHSEIVAEYQATCKVSPELYQAIDKAALFHPEPDVHGPTYGLSLEPDLNIEIEAQLATFM